MRSKILLTLVVSLFFMSELSAETIILKNGQTVYGKVIKQSRTDVTLDTDDGQKTILKKNIKRIRYTTQEQEQKIIEAEKRKAEEIQRKKDEARRKAEEEKRRIEEQQKRAEEERRLKAEEEQRRIKEEADRKSEEAEKLREAEQERIEEEEEARLDAIADQKREKWLSSRHSLDIRLGRGNLQASPMYDAYYRQFRTIASSFDGGFSLSQGPEEIRGDAASVSVEYLYRNYIASFEYKELKPSNSLLLSPGHSTHTDPTTGISGESDVLDIKPYGSPVWEIRHGSLGWNVFSYPSFDIGIFAGYLTAKESVDLSGLELEDKQNTDGSVSKYMNLSVYNSFVYNSKGGAPEIRLTYRTPWDLEVELRYWGHNGKGEFHLEDGFFRLQDTSNNPYEPSAFRADLTTSIKGGDFILRYPVAYGLSLDMRYSAIKSDMQFENFQFLATGGDLSNIGEMYLVANLILKDVLSSSSEYKSLEVGLTYRLDFSSSPDNGLENIN